MKHLIFIDFDHCLAPCDHDIAATQVKKELSTFGQTGITVGNEFSQIYYHMVSVLHDNPSPEAIDLNARLNAYPVIRPKNLSSKNVDQKWSRELWLKYLSDKHNLDLDGKMIIRIVEKYWETLAANCKLYPDAVDFLKRFGNSVFVITGSDDRLIFRKDSMVYDPKVSETKKIGRLEEQGLRDILPANHIITADPYSKTHENYWRKVISMTGLTTVKNGVVIEDSLPVIVAGRKRGFRGYVLDRYKFYNPNKIRDKIDGYFTSLKDIDL